MGIVQSVVKEARTDKRGCGGFITYLTLEGISDASTSLQFSLKGRHRIDAGEIIRAEYETHSLVNWIRGYDILDKDGHVIYSDVAG